jgi:hypothetical protein
MPEDGALAPAVWTAAKAWESTPSFGKKGSRVFAVGMVAPCAQAARLLKSDKVGAVVVKDS